MATGNNRIINTNGGNYNERIEGDYIQGNFYAAGQSQGVADTVAEIQQLLETLEKFHSSNTSEGKKAIATEAIVRIENNKSLSKRVLSALTEGGISAFAQFLNHPAASFVIAALADWRKTKGV